MLTFLCLKLFKRLLGNMLFCQILKQKKKQKEKNLCIHKQTFLVILKP